jgi:hypothetical protein
MLEVAVGGASNHALATVAFPLLLLLLPLPPVAVKSPPEGVGVRFLLP